MSIRVPLEMNARTYWLSPFTSKIEKDILIMTSFEVKDVDKYLELLGFYEYDELTDDEKKVILWKFREISLGNEIEIRFTCDCSQVVETQLQASDFLVPSKRNDDIKKLNIRVTDETLHRFVDLNQDELDDLPLKDYEFLLRIVKENQETYDYIRKAKCPSCGKSKSFNLGDFDYILDSLSDENLSSMYKVYSHLTYNGKFTKEDIDNMYPFERTIFVGLLHSMTTNE